MKILITGTAGFIGFHLANALAESGNEVVGIDDINDYYAVQLKFDRLKNAGFNRNDLKDGVFAVSKRFPSYRFMKIDLAEQMKLKTLFETEKFDVVCNLAAQAGVRYSLENPAAYIQSNVVGFTNILENCRHFNVGRLIYASSSSVYGQTDKVPFAEDNCVDKPESVYAATKRSGELLAYTYSKLFHLPTVGLRFFTVYGPWGRPDMAPILFMKSILQGKTIRVFNHGNMERDFTFIDDIIEGLRKVIALDFKDEEIPYRIYNIGNSSPVKLMDFIHVIEQTVEKKAEMKFEGMQPGDVVRTFADTSRFEKDFNFKPSTAIADGIKSLYAWYKDYTESENKSL